MFGFIESSYYSPLCLLSSTSVADHSWSVGIAFGIAIESQAFFISFRLYEKKRSKEKYPGCSKFAKK